MIAIQPRGIERTVREGWLDWRVPLPRSDDPDFVWMLLERNGRLLGPARFEQFDAERMGVGVQVPDDSSEERIEAALSGIREAEGEHPVARDPPFAEHGQRAARLGREALDGIALQCDHGRHVYQMDFFAHPSRKAARLLRPDFAMWTNVVSVA